MKYILRTKFPLFAAFVLMVFCANTKLSAQYCVTGCNENTYINTSDPNTLEYDNMISLFHTSIVKEANGDFKIWGQAANANGVNNLTATTIINPANGFNYTGTILKSAGGSTGATSGSAQFTLLTTNGLYIWGTVGFLVSSETNGVKNSTAFGSSPVAIGTYNVPGTNANGLPNGVNPSDVKMMFGSYRTLAIVTCTGDAWILSFYGNKNGDGTTASTANNRVWHRVSTASGIPLTGVVALRGTPNAMMALTSNGKIYTWGTGTYINNGASTNRTYATEMSLPTGAIPKMIGMTQSAAAQTYYLLATDGKLYSMGNNTQKQLGNWNGTTASNTWVRPLKPNAAGTASSGITFDDVVWISPNEHDNYGMAAINILTSDKKQYAWGSNDGNMIGGAITKTNYDPIFMPGKSDNANGLKETDAIIAVETGGHTTINVRQCSQKFGYVGHKINGSMANGDSGNPDTYDYDTSILIVCGAATSPSVSRSELKICAGLLGDLPSVLNGSVPSGNNLEWWTTDNRQAGTQVSNPIAVGPGTYYAFYIPITGSCETPIGTKVVVSYKQPGDDGDCACYNPAVTPGTGADTKLGITLLKRAGTGNTDNWPMARKSGHIALESNSKGFVITRIAKTNLGNITNPQEGMMVYDTTDKCLKIYSDGTWNCFSNPACP